MALSKLQVKSFARICSRRRRQIIQWLALLCYICFAIHLAKAQLCLIWIFYRKRRIQEQQELTNLAAAFEVLDFMHNQRQGINPPTTTAPLTALRHTTCLTLRNLHRPHQEADTIFGNRHIFATAPKARNNTTKIHASDTVDSANTNRWQSVRNAKRETYLFSAFYDDRPQSSAFTDVNATVRILGMIEERIEQTLYCQLWFHRQQRPLLVKAQIVAIWERVWDPRTRFYTPVLITCPISNQFVRTRLPSSDNSPLWRETAPSSVSVAASVCSAASNLLLVRGKPTLKQPRKNTVVCVKGMDFLQDISKRLVEWLEANFMFGVDKVLIYTYSVHPNIAKVLAAYQDKGVLEEIKLTLAGNMPNNPSQRTSFIQRNRQQKRRNEIIPYNDCVYRNLYTHEYALIIDIDEIVVPRMVNSTYQQMIDFVKQQNHGNDSNWSSFSTLNAFFFDNLTRSDETLENREWAAEMNSIPEYLHMLKHPYRSRKISEPGNYGKSFMYIPNVVSVFNHFPLHKRRIDGIRRTFFVNQRIALKHHYKRNCPIESREECQSLYASTTVDDSLLLRKSEIIHNVQNVLEQLQLA